MRVSADPAADSQNRLQQALIDLLPDLIFIKDLRGRIRLGNLAYAHFVGVQDPNELIGRSVHDFFPKEVANRFRAAEEHVTATGETCEVEESVLDPQTGGTHWMQTTRVALRDADGRIIGLAGISRDLTEHKRVEEALLEARQTLEAKVEERTAQQSEERLLLRTLIDNLPDAVYAKDTEGRKTLSNPRDVANIGRASEAEVLGKNDFELFPHDMATRFFADDQSVIHTGQPVHFREEYVLDPEGHKRWLLTSKLPIRDANGKIHGLVGIGRDITALKEAEAKAEELNRDLLLASRHAGMAEVATGVLHNVGNVLNSVNVSAALIAERLRDSKLAGVTRLSKLLQEQGDNLGQFLSADERGRQVPAYLAQLSEHLEQERDQLRQEIEALTQNIEHIKEIVSTQQNYARVYGVVETLRLHDLVEDALRIHGGAYARHGVAVRREFDPVPAISSDKHKILQILVNLLHNAKYACDAAPRSDKQVTVRIRQTCPDRIVVEVADNGVGIAPEHMPRIFSQGFTTRKGGHGFGLHSGALAAKELGGTLSAESAGLGQGATFKLVLPLNLPQEAGGKSS